MATRQDVYILNSSFDSIDLIEGIHSFIWTIRYNSWGDFTMKVPISRFPYTSLQTGNYVWQPTSNRLMMIESVIRNRDSEEDLIEVTGRSVEAFLEERVVTPNTTDDYWKLTGNVGWIATELVRRICIDATEYSASDKIDNLRFAEQDASTISREVKIKPSNLYVAVKELCDEDNLGFRIFFDIDTKLLTFRVYRGADRSTSQSTNPRVVFSGDLDNMVSGSFLKSVVGYKNVAYVKSKTSIRTVKLSTATLDNMRRRVLWVDASDIENPTNALLDSRGRIELSQYNYKNLVDGEIKLNSSYIYGVDYEIGDVVTIKTEDGGTSKARVTEFVTIFDHDGFRYYPTFTTIE